MARSSRPPLPALDTAPGVTRSNCSSYRWRTFPVCWLRCSCAACDGGRMWRQEPRFIQSLHMLALLTAVATFPLIFMGGLVTSHAAGMSVPDWPNSYGYNMFLFPPRLWVGGVLYEHTHRLMGTVVGFCSVLLALCAWGPGRSAAARRVLLRSAAVALTLGILAALGPFTYFNNEALTGNLRQAAAGFGSLALVLGVAAVTRTREERRWVRWLAVALLAGVIFQGVLGGLRVVLVQLDLAVVHACFAQA